MSDLILHNARIWTGDPTMPWAEAAAITNGEFTFVGRERDVSAPVSTPSVDARGLLVLPGLIDSHAHLLTTGLAMRSVDLKGAPGLRDAAAAVAKRCAAVPKGTWVQGTGWDQNLWPDQRFPHRGDLDAVAPNHPVILAHTSGHCIWVNTAALRESGVGPETPVPSGGAIDTDVDGEPAGILRDAAMQLVYDAVPKLSTDERLASLREAIAHAHSFGITCVHAMEVGRGELRALRLLHEEGSLSLRVRAYLSARRLDEWIDAGLRTGDGDATLRIGGVKFYADGALGSLTAWMQAPYEGTDDTGLALQPPGELEAQVRRSLEHGLAPAIHAIGDRANSEVLDIMERTANLSPHLPRRIEHAQLLLRKDIGRFASLDVTAAMQPIHATQDMKKVDRAWGSRGETAYAFASLLRAGTNLAFGSDSPVETMDPLAGIHAAVTRRSADGEPRDGWYPVERLPLEAALAGYTTGCAEAVGEAATLGRIAPGTAGDFMVLSSDLFNLRGAMRLLDARVEMTCVAGSVVYQKAEGRSALLTC